MSYSAKRTSLRRTRPLDPLTFARRLAKNMRRLRHERKLTVIAAARRAKMHWRHWQKLEAGGANPTILTMCRVAGALGVDPAVLLLAPPQPRKR